MPELPEVITIITDLQKEVAGKKITRIQTFDNYSLTPSFEDFEKNVLGHKIDNIQNHAKLITISLSSGYYLVTHLNMTGLFLYEVLDPYIKVTLELDNKEKLHFSDVRMFGFFELWDKQKLQNYIQRYGPNPLQEDLTHEEFVRRIKTKNSNIKNILLDQGIISGIGNIYANDALYLSGIHPLKKPQQISDNKLNTLLDNLRLILKEGVKNRGSSIDRYRDIYNQKGFQQNFFRIYGKTGKPCTICNTPIEFMKIQGRGTFICTNCQPLSDQPRLL